jgi:hypothetical protein
MLLLEIASLPMEAFLSDLGVIWPLSGAAIRVESGTDRLSDWRLA